MDKKKRECFPSYSISYNMREKGKIIKIKGTRAIVRILRREACGGCNACGMGAKHADLLVETSGEAKAGDDVELEITPVSDRLFAVIAYLVPLIFAVVAFIIGKACSLTEPLTLAIAAVFLTGGFAVAYCLDRYYVKKKALNPKIIEIIKKS